MTTDDELDDLVELWHRGDDPRPLADFMAEKLGWSTNDVNRWVADARYRPDPPCICGKQIQPGEHHCWIHHVDERQAGEPYRVCGECWHIYQTAADLEAAYVRESEGMQQPAAAIFFCQECVHDF